MKKAYITLIDSACLSLSTFIVSAGRIGLQVELAPKDLLALLRCRSEAIAVC